MFKSGSIPKNVGGHICLNIIEVLLFPCDLTATRRMDLLDFTGRGAPNRFSGFSIPAFRS